MNPNNKRFNKHDVNIAKYWMQDRLFEQNGYCPRLCDIHILAMGGCYDSVGTFHPCAVRCRVNFFIYQFFENKLIEKTNESESVEVGFDNFWNYLEGGPADA